MALFLSPKSLFHDRRAHSPPKTILLLLHSLMEIGETVPLVFL
jgi:hypothetical protein